MINISADVRQQIAKLAQVELARRSYYDYVLHVHGGLYHPARHTEHITDILQQAIDKKKRMRTGEIPTENQYFIISMPPRHSKSMTITETLPSYYLGHFPDDRIIEASYSTIFAQKFGRKNKQKVERYGKQLFDLELSNESSSATDWDIDGYRGGMISRGIMAGVTGEGADLMIIDDPIKNREEADSEVYREKLWGEWVDSLSTRLHPGAIVIVIMTRWHEDDLVGRLQNPEYGEVLPWHVINMPLECDETHIEHEGNPLNRELGDPLWPERYDKDFIKQRKKYPSSFNALFQGRPTAQEGNIIKKHWWMWYDVLPLELDIKIMSVDASFKDTTDSAKCSIQVWGKKDGYIYKIDNHTARMDFVTTIQAILTMLKKHPDISAKYIEDKANGSAIISMLNRKIGGFIPIKADAGTGGKEARAKAVTPWIESGNVFLPRNTTWASEFVEECAAFPQGQYADQVDGMSQALKKLVPMIGGYDPWVATSDRRGKPGNFDLDEEPDEEAQEGFW